MAVNPTNLASNYVSQAQPQPQSHAERVVEKEKLQSVQQQQKPETAPAEAALKPTVNTEGQSVGNVINERA